MNWERVGRCQYIYIRGRSRGISKDVGHGVFSGAAPQVLTPMVATGHQYTLIVYLVDLWFCESYVHLSFGECVREPPSMNLRFDPVSEQPQHANNAYKENNDQATYCSIAIVSAS